MLRKLVQEKGQNSWNEISSTIYFENNEQFIHPKRCRDRWFNCLAPSIIKQKWDSKDDEELLLFVEVYGKKWSKISKNMTKKRSEHTIKNRYIALMKKQSKNQESIEETEEVLEVEEEESMMENDGNISE